MLIERARKQAERDKATRTFRAKEKFSVKFRNIFGYKPDLSEFRIDPAYGYYVFKIDGLEFVLLKDFNKERKLAIYDGKSWSPFENAEEFLSVIGD